MKVERENPDSILIILGDFNSITLIKEMLKYRQHLKCPTREWNVLDPVVKMLITQSRVALRHSDHSLVCLIPTYMQILHTNKPVVTTVKRWTSRDLKSYRTGLPWIHKLF